MNQSLVRHSQQMLDRAKREKKFIVTVAVNGKPIKDGSCTVQALTDLRTAQRALRFATKLLRKRTAAQPKEKP